MLTADPHRNTRLDGVDFYSPTGVVSGLGSAGRGYLAALRAARIPVSHVPVNELFIHQPGTQRPERGRRPCHAVSIVHVNADTVRRFLHYHASTLAASEYRIGLWVWELPALRDEWCDELRHFDEIWVPSTFCQRAVQATTAKPVVVMPHVVSASETAQHGRRAKLQIDQGAFVFLYMFDASSLVERKNPQCLVDAFEAAFPEDERVRLVLKVSNADSVPDCARYLDTLAKRDPRCIVLRQTMSKDELAGLIYAADCYVSPHRSEGFGLTVAEAMSLGVPVIATDYGGTADFVTEAVGYPLRYRLVEVERDYGPYAKGAIWADPSREHLQELLLGVVTAPRVAAAKGQRGRVHIRETYSAAAVGRRIAERLAAIRSI
jgi:glycosyltransferase involved in cell wall biosynthesis